MPMQGAMPVGVALLLVLSSCTTLPVTTTWPEPRPLGNDLPVSRPPLQPSGMASGMPRSEEPTGVLVLRQALALALLYNPELAAFSWEVRAGEARTLQAGLLPNPELELEIENVAGSKDLRGFDGAELTLRLSQLIELGGKRVKRVQVAALERDLAAWDYETKRVDVLTQVTQAFVEVLGAQERVAVQEELVRLAEQVLRTVAERVRAGKVSPVEETRASVAVANSRIPLEQARRELEAARQRLVATWGSTTPAFERAEGSLDTLAALPPLAQLMQRVAQNPDLARWVTEMERRQATLALEEARRVPDLTVGGGVRHLQETDANALVMRLAFPLPLFNRNQGGVLEAQYQLAKGAEARRAAAIRVQAGLGEKYAMLAAAFNEATVLHDAVLPGAQRAFDASNEGYRQGKFSFLEVLDAQRTLFEARERYITALAAYHKTVADIERLIGEPLTATQSTRKQE
jgi:cobalt-zinc-cadmium efflux system outer membrane protein